ncbi:MAG: T9SS type A sorting domain-containing protein [Flavobacteriales bacterium]|nr:T9SS type A sorting domain-containing protein [Flavobacteriales bacterium]
MRTIICILLLIAIAPGMEAQPVFQNLYTGNGSGKIRMIELGNGEILISMALLEGVNATGVTVLSASGEALRSHLYRVDTLLVLQSVRKVSDNLFCLVGGYYKDDCSDNLGGKFTYPAIWWMDTLGQISNLKHYQLNGGNCPMILGDLSVCNDGSILAWGRGFGFYAMRFLATGELAWARRFIGVGGVQFVKEFPNSDLLVGMSVQGEGAVVARMDAAGNFIWCKSYIRPKGMVHDALIESDDDVVIVGATDSIASTNVFIPLPSSYQPKLFMMRLDGDGEVQWCRGYESNPRWYPRIASRIEKAQDGNYLLLANIGLSNINYFQWPFLMKSSINGDTLWTRSFGVPGFRYLSSELLMHSDGSIMFNGTVEGNLMDGRGGASYVFKADSLGHLPCSERYQPIQVSELFPTASSITLLSMDGAIARPAYMEQVSYTPILADDACVLINGIGSPESVRRQRITIRPNPNTGRFTVQFSDPLMAESYYSVYDALGKLLYQRPLPAGATVEEIDLSRFGRGTYLIKLTDPEGARHERVVLE